MHDEYQSIVSQLVFKWTKTRFLSEKDRKRLLLMLSQMRMLCDSTYILDQKTRYDTKVEETLNILRNVFESGDEKVVIFSQWERMTRLIAKELDVLGVRYEYLHGGIPSEARKNLTDNFTELPESRVFLSTDAGSTAESASCVYTYQSRFALESGRSRTAYCPYLSYRSEKEYPGYQSCCQPDY